MAASFLSNPTNFLQSSSSLTSQKQHTVKGTSVCKPVCRLPNYPPHISKRSLSISLTSLFLLSLTGNANAAILEADDDLELLEKVKQDRKKRIEKQTVLNSSNQDKEYLQNVIYKLSKVGQAIENNDLPSAGSILGQTPDVDWLKKANAALSQTQSTTLKARQFSSNKSVLQLSSSPAEKAEVDTFNTSLTSLYSSVTKNDIEGSKSAFVDSATAFEKWTTLTGLTGQLKGL